MCAKKIVDPKNIGSKKFVFQRFLVQTYVVQKYFGPRKVWFQVWSKSDVAGTSVAMANVSKGRAQRNKEMENNAIDGLGCCDKVQTEGSIFEYTNWPRLQV